MQPVITWVNHASFVYDDGAIRLISDPWIEGRTFYNGWDLVSPTAMSFDDFRSITHIWISHEHPDHLSPPNLSRIDPTVRSSITVLYQRTNNQRVTKYLASLGFRAVIELDPEWVELSRETSVFCGSCRTSTSDDSYLAIRSGEAVTLNLNDCVTSGRVDEILRRVGKPDVLLAQFSFACWTGNKNQSEKRQNAANAALAYFIKNVQAFGARYVIPSASFSWFCNRENYWMNLPSNRAADAVNAIEGQGRTAILLYPGDQWQLFTTHENASALHRYEMDYERISQESELFENPIVPIEILEAHARAFTSKLKRQNNRWMLALLRPARIFLIDHQRAFWFSLQGGLTVFNGNRDDCDIALGSDGLDYALKYLWGGDTLNINGRFEKPDRGQFSRFRVYFAVASLNNSGIRFDFPFLFKNALVVAAKFFEYRRTNDSARPSI